MSKTVAIGNGQRMRFFLAAATALLLTIAGPARTGSVQASGVKPAFHKISAASIASGSTMTFNHDVGFGQNRFLVVAVASKGDSQQGVTVTYDNVPMTKLVEFPCTQFPVHEDDLEGPINCQLEAWVLRNPNAGTHQVKVTLLGASPRTMAKATSYTGVNQVTPTGEPSANSSSQQDNVTSWSQRSFPLTTPGDLAYSATAVGGEVVVVPSAAEGQTARGVMTAVPPLAIGVGDKRAVAGPIQTTMQWNYSASTPTEISPVMVAFAIKPAP